MNRNSFIWKNFLPWVGLIVLLTALAGLYVWSSARQSNRNQAVEQLQTTTTLVRDLVQAADPGTEDLSSLGPKILELASRSKIRLTLIDTRGKVIVDSDTDAATMDNHKDRPEVSSALTGKEMRSERQSFTFGVPMAFFALPMTRENRVVAVVRGAVRIQSIDTTVNELTSRIVLTTLASAVLLSLLSLVILLRIASPLRTLDQGALRLASGQRGPLLPTHFPGQLGTLAESLNRISGQLDEQVRTIGQQSLQQQGVLGSMNEGVLAIDTTERVITLNRAAATVLGVNLSEARGRSIQEVVRNVQLQRFITQTLASDQPLEDDVTLTTDPEPRFLQASGTPLRNPDGGKLGALVVLNDVTRLRRLENVRREFVANVSHELKTPVTAIKGFVETLREAMEDGEDPAQLQHFLTIIARQAERLQQIIEDLLMLSRIEQDNEASQIKLSLTQLHPVVDAAIDTCRPKASDVGITIDLRCPRELMVQANGPLLEQAVVNLLDNAIKYSVKGDTVMVDVVIEPDEVQIRVIDHGVGIAAEHLPHLFQRFYRVDKGRSRKLGGTGLGLAIVKHITQTHHGKTTVQSTTGQGSTFTIHLPLG
jgi:two-component system, OmpR family, phosphate regulon sensor histidine kinase PhoR